MEFSRLSHRGSNTYLKLWIPIDHFWFHSRQAGYGEILISLGLANGAEQYGSLIRFGFTCNIWYG